MPKDCYYLFENFYKGLLFSLVCLLLWSLLRKIIKKPIRKEGYENNKITLGWYFRYKLYLMVFYFLIVGILSFCISLSFLLRYWWCIG